jgi:cytochrome c peroxidase
MNKLFLVVLSFVLFYSVSFAPKNSKREIPSPYYDTSLIQPNISLLGRVLFYDPILSLNNTISCESCHSPYFSFAHADHRLSHGIFDSIGRRNAPVLVNIAWQKHFNWDGADTALTHQLIRPITHPGEMAMNFDTLSSRLSTITKYKNLFLMAYGDTIINQEKILEALNQFVMSIQSFDSKYDQVKNGSALFSEYESHGYELFLQHCNTCHTEPLFTNGGFENNGIGIDSILKDPGRYQVTQKEEDKYKFKVPTLRNIEVSPPYMHDGRFPNLSMVLFHYTNLCPSDTHLPASLPLKMAISEQDKNDLILFLKTLTDESFLTNKNYLPLRKR